MTKPSTAVVILNWNGEKLLREFLPSVLAGTDAHVASVIVADNGSTDGSRNLLREEFPQVRTLLFDRNYGFAEGYNRAVSELSGEFRYIVLLNSDVAVRPGWIVPLVEFMDSRSEVGACQPKILSYTDPTRFEYAGASGGFIDRNGYPYCRGRLFADCEEDKGQYDEPLPIFWATGAALMVRTKVYLDAGGLDSLFFAHMEEIDLCWRIHLAGYEVWAVPGSVVYHLGGGSLPAENPRKTYLNFRNNLLLLHKNLPECDVKAKLLKRRLLDTIAWAKFIATFDFKNAAAIWRAHRDFARMAKQYDTHPERNLLKERPDTGVNILTQYFLRRRRKFSSLPSFRNVENG